MTPSDDLLPSSTCIYSDWYTDPMLPRPWSTNWRGWENLELWEEHTDDGTLKVDKLFKEMWNVPGTVMPLAYMTSCGDLYFLFTASERYYYWAEGRLTVHHMEFAGPKEFLDHALLKLSNMPDVEILQQGDDYSWWL
ncbi:hypothetical protein C8J57DRAFT_1482134 [Mycena rebaudengoi]|nr:hypothetical protein C8J57DRAFT_1482134 [Mycena rebaudengoi]